MRVVKALWLEEGKLSFRRDVPVPRPLPGEALIRVRLAGICGTDLEMLKGYYPYRGVLGHEFVGEVVEAQDGTWLGSRVVGEITLGCGLCGMCRSGFRNHCESRTVVGIQDHQGVFAEFLTLPIENLHIVPKAIRDESAVFTEPLAAALEIQRQTMLRSSDRVLIVGAGRLGQLIAQTLSLVGCDLQVVVRHENQRTILESRNIPTISEAEVSFKTMDVVVEATGSPEGFSLARKALRPKGTIILKSTYRDTVQVDLSAIVVDEITLLGSRCGPFDKALDLLESGYVDPTPLIGRRYRLQDGIKAFEQARRPGALKVLLEP